MRFLTFPFEISSVKQRNERADGQKYYIGRPLLISPTWSTKFFFHIFLRFPLRRIDSKEAVTTHLSLLPRQPRRPQQPPLTVAGDNLTPSDLRTTTTEAMPRLATALRVAHDASPPLCHALYLAADAPKTTLTIALTHIVVGTAASTKVPAYHAISLDRRTPPPLVLLSPQLPPLVRQG